MTSNTQKILINCQEGKNNIERASISFILAASASKTAETVMFMTADAAELCIRGGTDGLQEDKMESINDLMAQYIGNGGKIWLCPICAKVRGISEQDLAQGVEIAGAPRTMAFLASGAQTLA